MNLCDIRDIRSLLSRHGFTFSKSLGQNFLTAPWVPVEIAESVGPDETCGVLEIGPGIGCLTEQLAMRAGKVVAVELDRGLLPVLQETLGRFQNIDIIHGDILKTDIPALIDTHLPGLRPMVAANLPYNITTPLLTALIESKRFETITVMIQREVALRIAAEAGTSDYGAFSLYMAYHTDPAILFHVPPDCFIPEPKVHSSVIRLTPRKTPPVSVDKTALFTLIKAAFAQRRKTLVNCLNTALPKASKEALTDILTQLGHDSRIRGETLDLGAFAELTETLMDADLL